MLQKAPKLTKEYCRINWNDDIVKIHNKIRGLSYIPGAFTTIKSPAGELFQLKIFRSDYTNATQPTKAWAIETDNNNYLRIYSYNGYLDLKEVQLSGKKIMNIDTLLRGFKLNNLWIAS